MHLGYRVLHVNVDHFRRLDYPKQLVSKWLRQTSIPWEHTLCWTVA